MSSQAQPPIDSHHDDDEIDLFELFQTLWNSKILIIACSILGLIISGAYAFTAKEQWTSEAYINQPRLDQITNYLDQRRSLERVRGNKFIDSNELSKNLYDEFIIQANSLDNRIEFAAESDYFKELSAGISDEAEKIELAIKIATQNLKIDRSDEKQIRPYYKFSFEADKPKSAQGYLRNYLKWASNKSIANIDRLFNNNLDAEILSRKKSIDDIEFKLKTNKNRRIEILNKALATAKEAGIKEYTASREISGSTIIEINDNKHLFMLGERYLSAEIQIENKTPLIFPDEYFNIARELAELQPLRQYNAEAVSFSYQLSPTLPITRDKPKRTLIMLIGIILGGMLGVFWALVRDALRKRKASL